MAGITQIKTFSGGMNKDVNYSILPENTYTHAENFKLIVNEDASGFVLEVAEGNSIFYNISSEVASGYFIAGHCYIHPYLVLFITQNITNTTPNGSVSGKLSKIVKIRIDRDLKQQSEVVYTDGGSKGYLNLSVTHPIQAVGVYEEDDIIKVYWVDGYNEDRFVNIMSSTLSTQKVDKFSMLPDVPTLSGTTDTRLEFQEYVSGNLKASKVQYTYQYYNVNGSATRYAPLSRVIPIARENPGSPSNYEGGLSDEEMGVGCKLKLNIPSTKTYNRVRLIALDYTSILDVPTVRIFSEIEIDITSTQTEIYIKDIGNTIGEILYDDFLIYGDVTYRSKALETKNNILFKGNIEDEKFDVDFDARAYRFNSSGYTALFQSDGSAYVVYDTGTLKLGVIGAATLGDWEYFASYPFDNASYIAGGSVNGTGWSIPETADCINYYNNPTYEGNTSYQYKYKAKEGSTTTIGAEGENISVSFDIDTLQIDDVAVGTNKNSTYGGAESDDPSNPYNMAYKTSLQRHEVYRLGIVFVNTKLQTTSVKWACDLKVPGHYEGGFQTHRFAYITLPNRYTIANELGLSVTLSNMPSNAYAWQVVMVKREADDRSVLANGILQTPRGDDFGATTPNHTIYYPAVDPKLSGSSYNTLTTQLEANDDNYGEELMMFISPEVNFYQTLKFESGDFLQYNGYFTYDKSLNSEQVGSNDWAAHKINAFSGEGTYTTSGHKSILSEVKIMEQQPSPANNTEIENQAVNIGGLLYTNYTGNNVALGYGIGLHGTFAMCYSSNPLSPSTDGHISYVSYRRNKFDTQYGGNTYYDRQRNEYIGISELRYANGSVVTHEGDTMISYYWYAKQAVDLEHDNNSWFNTLLFPTESSVAIGYRHDNIKLNTHSVLMREVAGEYSADKGIGSGDDLRYNQEIDLYQYNSVYSFFGSGQVYFDELLDQSDQVSFPNRVRASDVKLSGELQDSFTIFRSNNFIDLDGSNGPVNNLLRFKNQLFFWQDSAFGVLSVNQRALIQDNNPGILALGTGGVLDRYDYISETTGNQNPYSIVPSNTSIYWADTNKNEIVRYSGQEESLSKTKGLQSWFNTNGKMGWVIGTYDQKYNDIIFTISYARHATSLGDQYRLESDGTLDLISATKYNVFVNGEYSSGIKDGENNVVYYDSGAGYWLLENGVENTTQDKFYFNFKNDQDYTDTISFNEQIQAFVSFHSFKPDRYIALDQSYLSTNDDYRLFLHNTSQLYSEKSTYYGTTYDSIVTTVFNKDYPFTKVFDVIKWLSESKNSSNINIFEDTFSKVEIYNDYQHTGDRFLYYQQDAAGATRPTPISRRERTWSLQIPRNIVDTAVESNPDITNSINWNDTQQFKDRIRDKYIVTKFTYDNSNNYTFSVPFIASVYRKSYR